MVKTIPVRVLYSTGYQGYANGGVSETSDTLFLMHNEGWRDAAEDDPGLIRMVTCRLLIDGSVHSYVCPVNPRVKAGQVVGPMFGGNFVYSADPRFTSEYPLPIQDRYDSRKEYDTLFD